MNCKPGDLAAIVQVDGHPNLGHLIGSIVHVKKLERAWDGPALTYEGRKLKAKSHGETLVCEAVPDRWLRPIRDNDGEDETLTWAPKKQPEPA